jgi:hypothetical protein
MLRADIFSFVPERADNFSKSADPINLSKCYLPFTVNVISSSFVIDYFPPLRTENSPKLTAPKDLLL